MRLHLCLFLLAAISVLPLAGCNGDLGNKNAAADVPHPSANELDKALQRRPKVDDGKNANERNRDAQPKTWIGRAIVGGMGDGDGLSGDERDKLRDYIMANDEYLSRHMVPPKELILRANKRPEALWLHDKPKPDDGKRPVPPAAPGKVPPGPVAPVPVPPAAPIAPSPMPPEPTFP